MASKDDEGRGIPAISFGLAEAALPRDLRMGQPNRGHALLLPAEFIGRVETTGRSETSQ